MEFSGSEIIVSRNRLLQHLVTRHLRLAVHSQELFVQLANELIRFAEQAYFIRDVEALDEASRVLMNLPVDGAEQIGTYYYALAINREARAEAEALLETIADSGPITYRARAVQTLGANYHQTGQLDEALRFQFEALRIASDPKARGFQTALMAHWEIAIVKSLKGDHRSALADLKKLQPLINLIGKQKPFYFYGYCNSLAVELAELGSLADAEAFSDITLSSPLARVYSEWSETRDEIAAKRTAATPTVVAINRASTSVPSPKAEPRRRRRQSAELRPSIQWGKGKDSFQNSPFSIPATITTLISAISILDRVLFCISPRSPPTVLSYSQ
jgi:tetratricopeptide (TPR) repeat protein